MVSSNVSTVCGKSGLYRVAFGHEACCHELKISLVGSFLFSSFVLEPFQSFGVFNFGPEIKNVSDVPCFSR